MRSIENAYTVVSATNHARQMCMRGVPLCTGGGGFLSLVLASLEYGNARGLGKWQCRTGSYGTLFTKRLRDTQLGYR